MADETNEDDSWLYGSTAERENETNGENEQNDPALENDENDEV